MKLNDDEGQLGGTVPYGRKAKWSNPPTEEEVERIIELLTTDPEETDVEITDASPSGQPEEPVRLPEL